MRVGVSDPVSLAGPSASDVAASDKLEAFLRGKGLYEDEAGRQLRERVLGLLNDIVARWLSATLREKKGMTAEMAAAAVAGPCIYTFGSYRLGVAGANADIDTLCVGPRQIDMADFFGSLQSVLRARQEISSLVAVPDAYVPVMKLVFCGVDIDLLFSRLATSSVPRELNLRDDALVAAMEEKSVLAINGARVIECMLQLVPSVPVFRVAVRLVKHWAQSRGVYGNVLGYPGGVAYAIMVARICQLYPNAAPSVVVSRFFSIYARWKWPTPVLLCQLSEGPSALMRVWNPSFNPKDRRDLMPVITPAYPAMCSTYNVSKSTKHRIHTEIERAVSLAERQDLEQLCLPYVFFQDAQFKAFVKVEATAASQPSLEKWTGWVESQLRKIIPKLEFAPFVRHAVPRNKPTSDESSPLALSWWLGLVVDPPRVQADGSKAPRGQIDLKNISSEWTAMVMAFKDRAEDMKVVVSVVLPRQLPPAFAPPPRKKKKLETEAGVAAAHPPVLVPPSPLLPAQHQHLPPPPPAASAVAAVKAAEGKPAAAEAPPMAKRARVDVPLLAPSAEAAAAMAPEAPEEKSVASGKISIRLSSRTE